MIIIIIIIGTTENNLQFNLYIFDNIDYIIVTIVIIFIIIATTSLYHLKLITFHNNNNNNNNYYYYNPKSEKVGTVWKTQIKKESSDF